MAQQRARSRDPDQNLSHRPVPMATLKEEPLCQSQQQQQQWQEQQQEQQQPQPQEQEQPPQQPRQQQPPQQQPQPPPLPPQQGHYQHPQQWQHVEEVQEQMRLEKQVPRPNASAGAGWSRAVGGAQRTIQRTIWSKVEENTLLCTQATLGNKWGEIAQVLPGRNANMCKKRFMRLQAKGVTVHTHGCDTDDYEEDIGGGDGGQMQSRPPEAPFMGSVESSVGEYTRSDSNEDQLLDTMESCDDGDNGLFENSGAWWHADLDDGNFSSSSSFSSFDSSSDGGDSSDREQTSFSDADPLMPDLESFRGFSGTAAGHACS